MACIRDVVQKECEMIIDLKIVPNASRDEISGCDENGVLKVRIQSPPVEGAANKHLVKFLAKKAGVSKSKVSIVKGDKSRMKRVAIEGLTPESLAVLKGDK